MTPSVTAVEVMMEIKVVGLEVAQADKQFNFRIICSEFQVRCLRSKTLNLEPCKTTFPFELNKDYVTDGGRVWSGLSRSIPIPSPGREGRFSGRGRNPRPCNVPPRSPCHLRKQALPSAYRSARKGVGHFSASADHQFEPVHAFGLWSFLRDRGETSVG